MVFGFLSRRPCEELLHIFLQSSVKPIELFKVAEAIGFQIICSLFPVWLSVVNVTQGGRSAASVEAGTIWD